MKARSAKAKGTRLEKWTMDQLKAIGLPARKQPMSGALQDFPHDVYAELPDGRFIVECKSWKAGWRTGDKAMGQADCLVIKRDYGTPCVYMPWTFFERLVSLAHEGRDIIAPTSETSPPRPESKVADSFRTRPMTSDEKNRLADQLWTRVDVPQSLLTGKSGKPKAQPRKWRK